MRAWRIERYVYLEDTPKVVEVVLIRRTDKSAVIERDKPTWSGLTWERAPLADVFDTPGEAWLEWERRAARDLAQAEAAASRALRRLESGRAQMHEALQ